MRGLAAHAFRRYLFQTGWKGIETVPAAVSFGLPGPTPKLPSFHASSILRI